MKTKKDPPLFTQWYGVVGTLLERVGRFPKNLRPTLGNRLIDRSLDVLDHVVRLRYSRQRRELFRQANLAIEQVRILVRLAFERRLFSAAQYAELAEAIAAKYSRRTGRTIDDDHYGTNLWIAPPGTDPGHARHLGQAEAVELDGQVVGRLGGIGAA